MLAWFKWYIRWRYHRASFTNAQSWRIYNEIAREKWKYQVKEYNVLQNDDSTTFIGMPLRSWLLRINAHYLINLLTFKSKRVMFGVSYGTVSWRLVRSASFSFGRSKPWPGIIHMEWLTSSVFGVMSLPWLPSKSNFIIHPRISSNSYVPFTILHVSSFNTITCFNYFHPIQLHTTFRHT